MNFSGLIGLLAGLAIGMLIAFSIAFGDLKIIDEYVTQRYIDITIALIFLSIILCSFYLIKFIVSRKSPLSQDNNLKKISDDIFETLQKLANNKNNKKDISESLKRISGFIGTTLAISGLSKLILSIFALVLSAAGTFILLQQNKIMEHQSSQNEYNQSMENLDFGKKLSEILEANIQSMSKPLQWSHKSCVSKNSKEPEPFELIVNVLDERKQPIQTQEMRARNVKYVASMTTPEIKEIMINTLKTLKDSDEPLVSYGAYLALTEIDNELIRNGLIMGFENKKIYIEEDIRNSTLSFYNSEASFQLGNTEEQNIQLSLHKSIAYLDTQFISSNLTPYYWTDNSLLIITDNAGIISKVCTDKTEDCDGKIDEFYKNFFENHEDDSGSIFILETPILYSDEERWKGKTNGNYFYSTSSLFEAVFANPNLCTELSDHVACNIRRLKPEEFACYQRTAEIMVSNGL